MLGAEQRGERDAGRLREQIDRARTVARPSRLVRQQPDAFAAQPREAVSLASTSMPASTGSRGAKALAERKAPVSPD